MRHQGSEQAAQAAAEFLRGRLGFARSSEPLGLVLGTGWGDVLSYDPERKVAFTDIPGFDRLDKLEGHAREVVAGTLGGREFVALRGRIHLNERPADPALYAMNRLQIEMLLQLGVKRLVLTCAAGSLKPNLDVGDVMLIDGFVTLFAPDMPLFAGEFCSPEDAVDVDALDAFAYRLGDSPILVKPGAYAMVRGPFFEGRRHDKRILAQHGASAVGMSVLPEACIASLYKEEGVRVLPLAFITNGPSKEHSHEENVRRAKESSAQLGGLLEKLARLP